MASAQLTVTPESRATAGATYERSVPVQPRGADTSSWMCVDRSADGGKLAKGGSGVVYIGNFAADHVGVYSLHDGALIRRVGRAAVDCFDQTPGALVRPTGIAVDGDEVFVVSESRYSVDVFARRDGALRRHFGSRGHDARDMSSPAGIAVDGVRVDVFVADCGNNRVQVFARDGTWRRSIARARVRDRRRPTVVDVDDDPGDFRPYVLTVDSAHDELDFTDACVCVFRASTGELLRQLETAPLRKVGAENLSPCGVAVSGDCVFVADDAVHRVYVLDRVSGALLAFVGRSDGTAGKGNDELNRPTDLAVCSGRLYVMDGRNQRIQVFRGYERLSAA